MNIVGMVNLLGAFPVWHTRRMHTPASTNRYKNHRFPADIISHAVWLYFPHSIEFSGRRIASYGEGRSTLDFPLIHDA
jgi:hypothetical protein